ncbi:MAG: DUF1002 domain-containing protein [Butyricicoccus sp.]|nr:DUF1002 domain-containing protein [Butyricicoccus sp.]
MKKKVISLLLCLCFVLGAAVPALADVEAGQARAVIGANLNDEQVAQVYGMFGIERGSVKELTVTNAEEREYLDGLVDSSIIGTNSISCIYVEILPAGEGLQIETQNLTWCTQEMFINALVTAGIDDAKIIVAAPFQVSGTAALTGIYKAYEDISGQQLDEVAKLVSTQELVITGELADEIGSYDATMIVNEIKLILDETKQMSDEQIKAEINAIAAEYDIVLKDSQLDQLVTLCRALEKMNADELREKVEYVQSTIKRLASAQEKVSGITATVKNIVSSIGEFIDKIIAFFKRG